MARSTAYILLTQLDELSEDDDFKRSKDYQTAIEDVREFLKENYPDDFAKFNEDQSQQP